MQVVGTIEMNDQPVTFTVCRHDRSGCAQQTSADVPEETLLSVYVNDILTMQIGCSANHLVELVVGRMYSEGLIASVDEIDAISICENAMRADVVLIDREADLSSEANAAVPTCCTNNRMLNNYFARPEGMEPVRPVPWTPDQVFAMADAIVKDEESRKRRSGTHSAYLWKGGELLCCCEDIGRHNALDKVIGSALMRGTDLSRCALFTSGRVPTDMVAKVVRSRVPLLVSKACATDKTVAAARAYNLTLVCNASRDSMDVFNDPMR